ncbi:MAG: hypothetical protein SOT41_00430 [Candidatus Faecisoma sp.]|jgi:predicted DNA-binding protein YlxM (UPF0122 family)|nr:hypothetical protein [Acholeplasma sp.]MCI5677855.1 hypothetical protein [Acholeplasma sp.]MDY2892241.1 hypothetical protein [Candidatus Faecisoma sp.]CCY28287.1 uPF0122 protein HMPREF9488_03534 [Acholeplasma sp. CAG:878]
MEDIILYTNLFDCYYNLLTLKQQEYFKAYYFDNLTLQEIALNDNVSRNAVFKSLKDTIDKLLMYEEKLKIYNKKKLILNLVKDEKLKEEIINILD